MKKITAIAFALALFATPALAAHPGGAGGHPGGASMGHPGVGGQGAGHGIPGGGHPMVHPGEHEHGDHDRDFGRRGHRHWGPGGVWHEECLVWAGPVCIER